MSTTGRARGFSLLIVAILAWGTLLFGAPYPWAYWPLLTACFAVGAWGLGRAPASDNRESRPLVFALAAVALAAIVQLIPVSQGVLQRVSPKADAFAQEHDPFYAATIFVAGTAEPGSTAADVTRIRHPLSVDPAATWRGLTFLVILSVMLVGLTRSLRASESEYLAGWFVALGALIAAVAVLHRGSDSGKLYGFWQPEFASHPFGPFVNRNHFAGWMLMCLPVAMAYVFAKTRRAIDRVAPDWHSRVVWVGTPAGSRLILGGFAVVVMMLSLGLTLSRSGILCFMVASPLFAMLVAGRDTHWPRRLAGVAAASALVMLALNWAGFDAIAARFANTEGGALGGRLAIWRDGSRMLGDFLWTGTGLNTYGAISRTYQTSDLQFRYLEAHNDYLQLAIEGGLLVGVPIVVLLAVLTRAIWRRMSAGGGDVMSRSIRAGAVTGLIAIGLQEIVDFSLQLPANAVMFVVLCSLAMVRDEER